MDLYDDLDTKHRPGQIDGWSSSIKLLPQLALKKAVASAPVKREQLKRPALLAPTTLLTKSRNRPKDLDDFHSRSNEITTKIQAKKPTITAQPLPPPNKAVNDYDWDVVDEYDPLWPNEYDKLIKERREKRDNERKRRNNRNDNNASPSKYPGFGGRSDPETSEKSSPVRSGGAAIAPPPSLQESTPIIPAQQNSNVTNAYGSSSVAAKIMAKYGFKDGQGLGKKEQGMSVALQVEKTSKRGGRIIHENETPIPSVSNSPPAATFLQPAPPVSQQSQQSQPSLQSQQQKEEQTITEIMKSPSKVVLLRNMVGAGDVDEELEGEVKDECNTKYGEVVSVLIYELHNSAPDEAVRIFVEFKRIESAIKAVVDLNGRFFAGRQVKAGFYNHARFLKKHLIG